MADACLGCQARGVAAELVGRLLEVLERGDPAQQQLARQLIDLLIASPDDTSACRQAQLLVDAYLNDPHLTR